MEVHMVIEDEVPYVGVSPGDPVPAEGEVPVLGTKGEYRSLWPLEVKVLARWDEVVCKAFLVLHERYCIIHIQDVVRAGIRDERSHPEMSVIEQVGDHIIMGKEAVPILQVTMGVEEIRNNHIQAEPGQGLSVRKGVGPPPYRVKRGRRVGIPLQGEIDIG